MIDTKHSLNEDLRQHLHMIVQHIFAALHLKVEAETLIITLQAVLAGLQPPQAETAAGAVTASVLEKNEVSQSATAVPLEQFPPVPPSEEELLAEQQWAWFGNPWLTRTEWEVTIALIKAGSNGLTAQELALHVNRWHGTRPSNEAVQRMVSRISVKFEEAGRPHRGRTENVNLTPLEMSGKRRRGRPPKQGDREFRAYLCV